MWMKPDKEMGKSSELRTRFIRPSRYSILVGVGENLWDSKNERRFTHTHTFPALSVRFLLSLLFTLSSVIGPGPGTLLNH